MQAARFPMLSLAGVESGMPCMQIDTTEELLEKALAGRKGTEVGLQHMAAVRQWSHEEASAV